FAVYVLGLGRLRERLRPAQVGLSLLFALALPAFMVAVLQFPFSPERLGFYFAVGLLPFLLGGATLSLAFDVHGTDSNRLYFADLLGAAAGTLVVPLLLSRLGPETTVLATAVLPAMAALLLSRAPGAGGTAWTAVSAIAVAASLALAGWNHVSQSLTIRDAPQKALYKLLAEHPQAVVTSDRWNSYSRITSVAGFDDRFLARLFIDSDAETSVLRWSGRADDPPGARDWFRAFPFRLAPAPKVLVIGPGGGTDVVMAVAAGATAVTGVEMNPLMVDGVRRLGAEAGHLYDHPRMTLVMDEGRNHIERTDEKYDLIVLGFVDSWASVSSGGLALTENYLYTTDALAAYFDHLTDRGALAIVRWPVDVPRLVANATALLTSRGLSVEEAGRHVLGVAAEKPRGEEPVETVFMLARSPLSEQAVGALLAGHTGAHVMWAPFRPSEPQYVDLFAGRIGLDEYGQRFATLATPVFDDRPFYFAMEKPRGLPAFVVEMAVLPVLAILGFIALLLAGSRMAGLRAPGPRTVAYFGALGAGFIVCEIALIQRLILLLGHPIYSLVVILFTLLLAGGLGSFYARRFEGDRIRAALGRLLPVVIVLIVLAALLLPAITRAALPLPLPARIAVAGLVTFPFGFFMGMPFPLGLRRQSELPDGSPASVLWGLNGVASVLGSLGGVALAVVGGFTSAFLAAAACYAVALAARPR
ncbi:MAG: hypothetical protein MUF60_00135, partial [Vicinamibacterales bacterium]|nr:hypothetical protein [Vicinamibacterales bacterium]